MSGNHHCAALTLPPLMPAVVHCLVVVQVEMRPSHHSLVVLSWMATSTTPTRWSSVTVPVIVTGADVVAPEFGDPIVARGAWLSLLAIPLVSKTWIRSLPASAM